MPRPQPALIQDRVLPEELLDGSRDAARAAERIARRFLGTEAVLADRDLPRRLAWAIVALERGPSHSDGAS